VLLRPHGADLGDRSVRGTLGAVPRARTRRRGAEPVREGHGLLRADLLRRGRSHDVNADARAAARRRRSGRNRAARGPARRRGAPDRTAWIRRGRRCRSKRVWRASCRLRRSRAHPRHPFRRRARPNDAPLLPSPRAPLRPPRVEPAGASRLAGGGARVPFHSIRSQPRSRSSVSRAAVRHQAAPYPGPWPSR
jgi:hypothetical protein